MCYGDSGAAQARLLWLRPYAAGDATSWSVTSPVQTPRRECRGAHHPSVFRRLFQQRPVLGVEKIGQAFVMLRDLDRLLGPTPEPIGQIG